MEEIKYYIPEIEEFYVGFEFEYESYEDYWKKSIFRFDNDYGLNNLSLIINWLDNKEIRVKYLDKEDIENLGWEYLDDDRITYIYSKDNYELQYSLDDKIISILERINNTTGNRVVIYPIKNKSELKKLMKQLNIIK
jgi:hypothetical protein